MAEVGFELRDQWTQPDEEILMMKRASKRIAPSQPLSRKSKRLGLQRFSKMCLWTGRRFLRKSSMLHDVHRCVMHPASRRRVAWDCVAVIAILIELCVSPLRLYRIPQAAHQVAGTCQAIITCFWVLDIIAHFYTATYVNDILSYSLPKIAKAYLKSWFWFDLLMLLPDFLGFFLEEEDGPADVLRIARARRILRLLRFAKAIRLWKSAKSLQGDQGQLGLPGAEARLATTLIYFALVVGFSLHMLGSLWFLAGDTDEGWVREEGLQDAELLVQYRRSLEWALAKLPPSSLRFTVELKTAGERWLGICASSIALVSGSVFLSFMTNIMASAMRQSIRTKLVLQAVQKYCNLHGIPLAYSMQVRRYVRDEHLRQEMQQHMNLLGDLPDSIVQELYHEARAPQLHNHPFFHQLGVGNASLDLLMCGKAVQELYFLKGDMVFDVQKQTQGMYFWADGKAAYTITTTNTPSKPFQKPAPSQGFFALVASKDVATSSYSDAYVETGDHVAEPALWVKSWRHQGHLQAAAEGTALLLSAEGLFGVLKDHDKEFADTIVYARCFVQQLNEQEQVTDLPFAVPGTGY